MDNVQISTDTFWSALAARSYFKEVPTLQFARILEVVDNNLDDERFVHWIGQSNSTMWSNYLVENAVRVLRRADADSTNQNKVFSTIYCKWICSRLMNDFKYPGVEWEDEQLRRNATMPTELLQSFTVSSNDHLPLKSIMDGGDHPKWTMVVGNLCTQVGILVLCRHCAEHNNWHRGHRYWLSAFIGSML